MPIAENEEKPGIERRMARIPEDKKNQQLDEPFIDDLPSYVAVLIAL